MSLKRRYAHLAAALVRRERMCETASGVRHRASPHRIRRAKNRKGDVGSRAVRGRAGRETKENAEAGSSAARQLRTARRELASAEGEETSREASWSNDAALRVTVRQSTAHESVIGFARRRRRDWAGDVRFVVCRRRVSNMPIGSAGPYAAMAKASRRRPKKLRDDAGGDEQGEKRPVGWFEIKTRRSKPMGRTRARTRIHSRRPSARMSERATRQRALDRLVSIVNL
jgi:hypothetical protein